MSFIPSLRDAPADPVLVGMMTRAESMPQDPAANLIIEDFDEFAAGIIFLSTNTADYVIGTELATAYN